jgi:hypothetical protein
MGRVHLRFSDDLLDRLRATAAAENRSVNELMTRLAEAATNPEPAAGDRSKLRERLARAGIPVPGQGS